jgi:hypothetical protein
MNRLRREFVCTAIMSGLMPFIRGRAFACAFDGMFDGSIGYVHPRSVEVALGVRKAVADGVLAEQALAPGQHDAAALWRATEQLRQFGRRISASSAGAAANIPNIAALLSESALWTRYVATLNGFVALVHASGPQLSDAVIVTDLAVLTALNNGSLSMGDALGRTLIVIDANGPQVDDTANLLMAAFARGVGSNTTSLGDRTAWRGWQAE